MDQIQYQHLQTEFLYGLNFPLCFFFFLFLFFGVRKFESLLADSLSHSGYHYRNEYYLKKKKKKKKQNRGRVRVFERRRSLI